MNVFVLCTGRCGSESFMRSCSHMTNYTAGHESAAPWHHAKGWHPYRTLEYADRHIEIDNRLSWFLGQLDEAYGREAYYVHLLRDREQVAASLAGRGRNSVLFSFASGILQYYGDAAGLNLEQRVEMGRHYWDTVNQNITLFLRDKPRKLTVWLDGAREATPRFWEEIGATGDLEAALAVWSTQYNRRAHVCDSWL